MNTVASLPDRLIAMAESDMIPMEEAAALMEEAAAALTTPEQPEVVITTDESGRCVAVTRQDGEGRILSVIWEASEHGGGGEAVYQVRRRHDPVYKNPPWSEVSKGNYESLASYAGYERRILYTTPPTPSAPARTDKEQHVNAIRTLCEMGWRWKGGGWVAPSAPDRGLNPPPERERDMLAEAIRNAAVKRGIVREDASLTGPMLLLLCEDLAQEPSAPVVDDAMRKRTREWLASHNGFWDDDYVEGLLTAVLAGKDGA